MHIDEVKAMQERKEHLMRNEGHHVASKEDKMLDKSHAKDQFGGMHGIDPNEHGAELE